MLGAGVRRLDAKEGKFNSVTTGYFRRYLARDVARQLVAARFLAYAVADAFGATLYFAALHYISMYLRFSLGSIKVLSFRMRRSRH
jgi:hypothetical protein